MKKIIISKLFLYKHRFQIGYILLGLAYIALLFTLPLFAQTGISEPEMQSVVSSNELGFDSVVNGDLVDLPYRVIQKASIKVFGLSAYSIKLPSIIVGLLLGFFIILLLNRWFKNNVSLISSVFIILSTTFLFLAGNGTPLIMLVFWPVILLWLGSKIQGEKKPNPYYCFLFAIAMLLSIFTPYMIYFAIFCVVFVFAQPHLRFTVRSLPRIPLIIVGILTLSGIAALIVNIINYPDVIAELLAAKGQINYLSNINAGIRLLFSWGGTTENALLTPLIGLPVLAISLIGLFSTTKGFFASRNSIASLLILYTIIISGFNENAIVLVIIPLAILTAHGIKYILEKWYGLFPENPYARIFALLPLTVLMGLIIVPSFSQYANGYKYNPNVANNFTEDLGIIKENLHEGTLLIENNDLAYRFYQILEKSTNIKVKNSIDQIDQSQSIATLGKTTFNLEGYGLYRIITSEKSDNSDIIYIYKNTE